MMLLAAHEEHLRKQPPIEVKPKEKVVNILRSRYDPIKEHWDALDKQKFDRETNMPLSNLTTDWSDLAEKLQNKFDGKPSHEVADQKPLEAIARKERHQLKERMMRLKKKIATNMLDFNVNTVTDTSNKFRISGLPRPISLQSLNMIHTDRHSWDIKYQIGESNKVLKKQTFATISKRQSAVGFFSSTDNTCLRKSASYHNEVAQKLNKRQLEPREEKISDMDRIVAKKSFFLNPNRNDPKIIKTKNRLYVI